MFHKHPFGIRDFWPARHDISFVVCLVLSKINLKRNFFELAELLNKKKHHIGDLISQILLYIFNIINTALLNIIFHKGFDSTFVENTLLKLCTVLSAHHTQNCLKYRIKRTLQSLSPYRRVITINSRVWAWDYIIIIVGICFKS